MFVGVYSLACVPWLCFRPHPSPRVCFPPQSALAFRLCRFLFFVLGKGFLILLTRHPTPRPLCIMSRPVFIFVFDFFFFFLGFLGMFPIGIFPPATRLTKDTPT